MANTLDMTSDSNNILKTNLIIVFVVSIAYIIYYLYTQNSMKTQDNMTDYNSSDDSDNFENFEAKRKKVYSNQPASRGTNLIGMAQKQNSPGYCKYLAKEVSKNCIDKPNPNKKEKYEDFEHFENPQNNSPNLSQFPKDQLTADELLPKDNSSLWAQVNPSGEGSLKDRNFLQSGYHIGINTVGQTLRNGNLQLRSEPPCPQVRVSPWLQSTIEPDLGRKPFEIGGCA